MKRIFILFILFAFLSSCCDEKPVDIPEFKPPKTDKVVLIEEFTGVNCINCPGGAEEIKRLEEVYSGNIVSIAIHAGDLSEPIEESKYDFRCEDGEKLVKKWKGDSKPAAMIDRVHFEGEENVPIAGYNYWNDPVIQELNKEPVLNLNGEIHYNEENKTISININIFPLQNLNGDYRLNIALTESHIIDAQNKGHGEIDKNYEFNHVLRDLITTWNGDIINEKLIANNPISKNYTYTITNDEWKPENMNLIAFVTGTGEIANSPVLNAVEFELKE